MRRGVNTALMLLPVGGSEHRSLVPPCILSGVFAEHPERDAMAPKKAIAKKTTKRKAVTEVPAPAKKAATAAGGKLEVVIEACKS